MQNIQRFVCSLIEPLVTMSSIDLDPRVLRKQGKNAIAEKMGMGKKGIVGDFLWDLFNCEQLTPPESDFCITNNDCETGERCKEGECIDDPTHCDNTGCDENFECNEVTGDCQFVPECTFHADCDQVESGELCLERVCTKPPFCVENLGPTLGCAPTWTCVGGECVKVDCSVINSGNKAVCCTTPLAFAENRTQCCTFDSGLPGCP